LRSKNQAYLLLGCCGCAVVGRLFDRGGGVVLLVVVVVDVVVGWHIVRDYSLFRR
jgi:hypothetical protein